MPARAAGRGRTHGEAQAGVLPTDLEGRDSSKLGCGTGYVSACLARRGSRPAGLDNSAAHLATARQLQDRFGLRFPLIARCARPANLRRQAGRQSGDQRTAALLPAASRAVEPARWRAGSAVPGAPVWASVARCAGRRWQ
jgi:SAM-dependent methyltransferase